MAVEFQAVIASHAHVFIDATSSCCIEISADDHCHLSMVQIFVVALQLAHSVHQALDLTQLDVTTIAIEVQMRIPHKVNLIELVPWLQSHDETTVFLLI